ncbi:MAG: hypothetical protein WEC14_09190 [Chloroflexota bacterium]
MLEYGRGISDGPAGQVGGTGGGGLGGGGGDWGAAAVRAVADTVDTIAALPPGQLLLLAAAVIIGLWVLKRAF